MARPRLVRVAWRVSVFVWVSPIALSRRKQGFESPRERHINQTLSRFVCACRPAFSKFSPIVLRRLEAKQASVAIALAEGPVAVAPPHELRTEAILRLRVCDGQQNETAVERCPPKADVNRFWITKEIETSKKINVLFAKNIPLRGLKNLA
jgi:hypothetical protein